MEDKEPLVQTNKFASLEHIDDEIQSDRAEGEEVDKIEDHHSESEINGANRKERTKRTIPPSDRLTRSVAKLISTSQSS